MSTIITIGGAKVKARNPVEYFYGVQWDVRDPNPAVSRIGSANLHRTLPVHNNLKGALANDDTTINYYLDPLDWTKKADGTASNLDGTDGQVGMHMSKDSYWRFEEDGFIRRVMVSEFELPGFFRLPKCFLGSYEASLHRPTLKLSSVVNATADYRGGNNNAAWDLEDRTLLGRPATSLSRTQFRTYARNRGPLWDQYLYDLHKFITTYLFIIEYATRNSQAPVNHALTAEGYRQGGLGTGVTNINGTNWNNWNSSNPFIPCGVTNSLGNYSGEVAYEMPAGYGATLTTFANRYRGIELPFGHIWKNSDGVLVNVQSIAAGGESQLFVAPNRAAISDIDTSLMEFRGLLPRISNYIQNVTFGSKGDITPATLQANSTQFWCDYFYTSIPESGSSLRTLLWGGVAPSGASAGFGYSYSHHSPASAVATIGSRLCFLGA